MGFVADGCSRPKTSVIPSLCDRTCPNGFCDEYFDPARRVCSMATTTILFEGLAVELSHKAACCCAVSIIGWIHLFSEEWSRTSCALVKLTTR